MCVGHLLLPANFLPGTHWAMTCVIRCLALTVSDVWLKLACFQSNSTYIALEVSQFMCCINSRLIFYVAYPLTYLMCSDVWASDGLSGWEGWELMSFAVLIVCVDRGSGVARQGSVSTAAVPRWRRDLWGGVYRRETQRTGTVCQQVRKRHCLLVSDVVIIASQHHIAWDK